MKNRSLLSLLAVILILSLTLSAWSITPGQYQTASTPVPVVKFDGKKMAAPNCDYGGEFKSIEMVDDFTVKFTLCQADVAFLSKIAVNAYGILDKDNLAATGGVTAKINDAPVGTGPYIMKEYVRGDHITLEANPTYWGGAPKNKTLILRWSKEAAQRLLELKSGNVSGIDNIGTDDWDAIKADKTLALAPRPNPNLLYLAFNNTIAPYTDVKVRQAFAMGIDRQRIIDNFYPAGSEVAQQFVPPIVKPGYTDGFKWYAYNPAEAKKLLTEAKFDFSKEYVLSYADRTRPYFPQPAKIAQDLQAQFKELGINMKLDVQEWAAYLPNTRDGKVALFLLGWGEDYPDATNWYDVFMTGSSKAWGTPYPGIVAAIKKAGSTADVAVRQKSYDEVNKLVKDVVQVIPLAHGTTGTAWRADVQNVVIGPYNENFAEMATKDGKLVFLMNGEPVGLYCSDETDGDSFRACDQIYDPLYAFEYGKSTTKPALAEKCTANDTGTEWTCTIRKGVKFSNGATLDASDVVATFVNMWDAQSPYHKGNAGNFQYWPDFFGPFINAPVKK